MEKSMQESKYKEFLRYLRSGDEEFYEMFLVHLSDEELERFLEENPNFLKE